MKRNTLNVIILTLTVINLVLNILIIFSIVPNANKTNQLIDKIAKIVDLDISEYNPDNSSSVDVENLETVAITAGDDSSSKLTINLKSTDGKPHYAVINAYMTINKEHKDYSSKSGSITNAMPLIASTVTEVVSQYDADMAKDPSVQNEMKTEILNRLRDMFQSDMIYGVVFESILIS